MKSIQQQVTNDKKNGRVDTFKEIKLLYKEFDFSTGTLKDLYAGD
jgi:hypothetical protein